MTPPTPSGIAVPCSLSPYGTLRSTVSGAPLNAEDERKIHTYWRACNFLALGMIYLRDNPLLQEPLKPEHIKNRLLGHWGSSPGLSFIYVHLNRLIKQRDLDMIFTAGPNNQIDRFSLAMDAIDRTSELREIGGRAKERFLIMQIDCRNYAYNHGIDSPETNNWTWPG